MLKDKSMMKRFLVRAALVFSLPFALYSCYDGFEQMTAGAVVTEETRTNDPISVDNPSALKQQSDGTWKAENARVPLVGVGRVVNQVSKETVSVASGTGDLGAIVNLDLTDSYKVGGLVGAGLGTADAIAVRDIYRTYSEGQKVGFVIDPGSGSLLSLDVLSGSVISFYCNGNPVDEIEVEKDNSGGIGLDLLGVSRGENTEQTLIVNAPCIFDEVRLKFSGAAVTALSESVGIKYAFVGDNSDEEATVDNVWFESDPTVNATEGFITGYRILGYFNPTVDDYDNLTNNTTDKVQLGNGEYITVNFGKNIPAGYEVGYVYDINSSILGINLLGKSGPELIAYDSAGTPTGDETESEFSVLGVDLVNVNTSQVKVKMVLNAPCYQLKVNVPNGLISGLLGALENIPGLGDIVGGLLNPKLNFYYAYIRKPVTIDNSSYFAFPGATIYTDTYQLPKVQSDDSGATVQYQVISWPSACKEEPTVVDGDGILTGATANGAYVIQAVYTKDGVGMSYTSTIYRESLVSTASGCNTYITATSYGAYPTETIDSWGGSLISILSELNNPDAVVDDDYNNYATRSGINVVENKAIYAMKTTRMISAGNGSVRAGFIIEPNLGLLDVNLLEKFEVRLYNGNTRVDEGATSSGENSNVLGLDLIGDGNGRLRVYVETDKAFDRLELWSKGLADVSLFSQLRIYGAFFEDTYCSTSFAQDLCMEVMNNSNYGVDLDYSVFEYATLVGLKDNIDGLGYLIDNDLDTGVEIGGLLNIGGISLGLKFNDMPAGQPIGIVLDGMGGLANINLSGITMTVYNGESEVASKTSFDLLDLDLINKTGKLYLEMTPSKEEGVYNRLKITLGGVNVSLKTPRITGIYTRKDSNGDGIPDCVQSSDDNSGFEFKIKNSDICYPENIILNITGSYSEGAEYIFKCKNYTTNEEFQFEEVINSDKTITLQGLSPGEYSITAYSPLSGSPLYNDMAYIHPAITEWLGKSTDWNSEANWTNGVPARCTNVILRKGVPYYPVLTKVSSCANIHFEEGAYIQNIDRLRYDQAFVDMLLPGGTYTGITAPLMETFSGDMFVNTGVNWTKEKYFTYLDSKNYPENRVSPIVYQAVWGSSSSDVWNVQDDGTQESVTVQESGWTEDFNRLNYEHVPGKGINVRPGEETDRSSYRLRFPKNYTEYNYYRPDGTGTTQTATISREDNIGKIVTNPNYTTKPLQTDASGYVAVGNPYLSMMSVQSFFSSNQSVVSLTLDGIEYTSEGLSSMVGARMYIKPAEAFVIKTTSKSSSITVTFNAGDVYSASSSSVSSRATAGKNALYLQAQSGGETTCASVWQYAEASNGLDKAEDVAVMIDKKNMPAATVFTIAEKSALSIQSVDNSERIPVGLIVDGQTDVVLKLHTLDTEWKEWKLVDTKSGKHYSLADGEVEIDLGNTGSSLTRFYLQK